MELQSDSAIIIQVFRYTLCYFYGDIKQYSNRDLCVKLRIINRRKRTSKQQNRRRTKPQLEQNRLTKMERIQEYNTVCEKVGFKSKY